MLGIADDTTFQIIPPFAHFHACSMLRDVLNHVYFDKRSLFLAGLRKTLEKANKKNGDKYKAFSFEYLKGDVRKPVLAIVPSFSSSVVVRLIPVVCWPSLSSPHCSCTAPLIFILLVFSCSCLNRA